MNKHEVALEHFEKKLEEAWGGKKPLFTLLSWELFLAKAFALVTT